MTDTATNFDPIPRLQQIAATIEESGADTFDAPATAAYYIDCAIKEIERLRAERDDARHGEAVATATLYGMIEERTALRAERDEARREVCVRMQQTGFLRGDYAAERGWDCYKKEPNDIEAHEVRGDVAGPEGAD
jgi:hypothetical protein